MRSSSGNGSPDGDRRRGGHRRLFSASWAAFGRYAWLVSWKRGVRRLAPWKRNFRGERSHDGRHGPGTAVGTGADRARAAVVEAAEAEGPERCGGEFRAAGRAGQAGGGGGGGRAGGAAAARPGGAG